MPKAIKRRIDKKTQVAGDLGETVADLRNRLKKRQKTLVYAFLAACLIIITVGSVFVYHRIIAGRAQELEYEGYKILTSAPNQKTPANELFNNALEKFNASFAEKKNPIVLLYIASCDDGIDKYDEAIKPLKKIIDEYPDPKISSLAYYKMAIIYLNKGDVNNALKTFDTLIAVKDALLQDMALMESGRTLELVGRTEEAKNKYNELINKFPSSPLVSD